MQTYVTTISYTTNIDEKLNPDQLFGTARALLNNPFVNDMRVTIEVAAQNGTITDMNVVLPGENSRYQAERDCMERAKAAGWVQRDGKIFNGHDYANLVAAEDHPDSVIYTDWSECCAGENLTDETPAVAFSPAGFLVGSAIENATAHLRAPDAGNAHPPADTIPRRVPRHDPDITTETGIVTKHVDIRVGSYPNSKIGGTGHAGDAAGYVSAGSLNIAMGDPVEPAEPELPPTYTPIDGLKPGWDTYQTKKGWCFRKPDGPDVGYFETEAIAITYAFEKAAWYGHVLDRSKARPGDTTRTGETPPMVVPTPTEAFTDAIDKALDVLLYDVPGWRNKFHPLASSKGKRALEDLVGLVATIRAELKSETDKNVTN